MTRIQKIVDVNEIIVKWPRLLAIAQQERDVEPEPLLQMYLQCLDHGAVFFAFGDKGLMGACCVESAPSHVNLLCLPRDNGVGMAKECLEEVFTWAKHTGYDEVRVVSTNLCGSSFRYFEKSLGFRRHAVVFKKSL